MCTGDHVIFQDGEEEEMWLRLKSTLEQCVELEPGKLRAVFDMLLNAAQPQLPSILEYSYAQITSTLVGCFLYCCVCPLSSGSSCNSFFFFGGRVCVCGGGGKVFH